LPVHGVRARDLALGLEVREQRKAQVAMFREREMAPDAVDGDSQDLGAQLAELRHQLAVDRQLVGADRAPVGGIEGEDHVAPRGTRAARLAGRGWCLAKSPGLASLLRAPWRSPLALAITAARIVWGLSRTTRVKLRPTSLARSQECLRNPWHFNLARAVATFAPRSGPAPHLVVARPTPRSQPCQRRATKLRSPRVGRNRNP